MYEHTNVNFDVLELIQRFTTQELLGNLERTVGTQRYRSMYLPMLERFVERVGDLPLSQAVYSEVGGCVLSGVLAGSLAVATCDTTIFSPTATSAERMTDDVMWKWLAFCSTLANCYLLCTASVSVIDGVSGEEYSFADDAPFTGLKSVKATWVVQPTVSANKLMPNLFSFFFPGQFAHLDRNMIGELGLSINPSLVQKAAESQLSKVVRSSIQKILSDEKARLSLAINGQQVRPEAVAAHAQAQITGEPIAIPGHVVDSDGVITPIPTAEVHEDDEVPPAPIETQAMKLGKEYIASLPRMKERKDGVTVVGTSQIIIENQLLGHGTEKQRTFEILKDAGFVLRREEKTIVLNEKAAAIYHMAEKIMNEKREAQK